MARALTSPPRYAALLRSVMAPGCRYLLSTVEYAPCGYEGTPRSVAPEDFRPEFGELRGEFLVVAIAVAIMCCWLLVDKSGGLYLQLGPLPSTSNSMCNVNSSQ